MRIYASRVSILSGSGYHLRSIPGPLARAMVDGGTATVKASEGRVRMVELSHAATTHAERIGPPTGTATGVTPFHRWVHVGTSRIVEHHPRCLYPMPLLPED